MPLSTTIRRMQKSDALKTYRLDIDGLRAIAVLLVLIFHFTLVPRVTGGFIGVDVFFVISGFLITGILKRQIDAETLSFRSFYAARVRRLAPALIATLAATFCAGLFFLFPNDLRELSTQLLASQAYVANIYFWRTVNYFGLNGANVFLLHTWSLAVEEQFYLFYPVVLYVLHRWFPRYFWQAVVLLFVLSFGLNVYFVGKKPEAAFYLLPTRAWELLAGALTGWLMARTAVSSAAKQFLGLAGLVLIAAGAVVYRPEIRFPGYFALMPVLGSSLVLFAHDARRTVASTILEWAPLRYVGRISYPLYLVHWPLHVFASRALGDGYDFRWRMAMFVVSGLLASALYHLIETPVRDRRWFSGRRPLLGGYAVALLATVAAVSATRLTGGLPGRFPSEVVRLAGFVNDKSPPLTECEFSGSADAFDSARVCKIGNVAADPRWVVFGDSHAWATHDAFDEWLRNRHESAIFMFRHGCAPILAVHFFGDDGTCFRFNQEMVDFIRRTPSLNSVVLVSTWRQGRERLISTDDRIQPSDAMSRDLFGRGLSNVIAALASSGKSVYVWEPLPGATANVPLAMAEARLHGVPAAVDKSRADYLSEYDFFFQDLAASRSQVKGVVSSSARLCASGKCETSLNGSPLYFDNSHPTRSSASFFATILSQSIGS